MISIIGSLAIFTIKKVFWKNWDEDKWERGIWDGDKSIWQRLIEIEDSKKSSL